MRLAVMIEGQEGVGWDDWLAVAAAAEDGGFDALLRSDHYLSVDNDPERGALDAWGTINALAARTARIRLGTLVSPVTFRPAAVLARLALTADHVSGGRVDVGMGTGWHKPEHDRFGFPFPPMKERMDELERQLDAVTRLWATTYPPPVQRPRPHLILGGQARRRSAALAARHADEYNLLYLDPATAATRAGALAQACEAAGRDPATLRLSMMTGFVAGADRDEVLRRARELMAWRKEKGDPAAWLDERVAADAWIVGTSPEILDRLGEYAAAGLERVMLQHHLFRDLDALSLLARDVLPALAG